MADTNLLNNCIDCEECWKNFQVLSKAELELVNENRYETTFKPGEIILKQGTPASNALFLSKGLARNYIEGFAGRNLIMKILQPGELILSPGAFSDLRHTYSVAAITLVNACFISFDVFRQLVRSNGDFAEGLLEDMSNKSVCSYKKMVNLSQKKMPGRIAEVLLYFADEIYHSEEFDMALSRQELGEMTNMVKESVVRILKEMEENNIITVNSSLVKINDRQRLIEISEKG